MLRDLTRGHEYPIPTQICELGFSILQSRGVAIPRNLVRAEVPVGQLNMNAEAVATGGI
jgi:hypothetical protein